MDELLPELVTLVACQLGTMDRVMLQLTCRSLHRHVMRDGWRGLVFPPDASWRQMRWWIQHHKAVSVYQLTDFAHRCSRANRRADLVWLSRQRQQRKLATSGEDERVLCLGLINGIRLRHAMWPWQADAFCACCRRALYLFAPRLAADQLVTVRRPVPCGWGAFGLVYESESVYYNVAIDVVLVAGHDTQLRRALRWDGIVNPI